MKKLVVGIVCVLLSVSLLTSVCVAKEEKLVAPYTKVAEIVTAKGTPSALPTVKEVQINVPDSDAMSLVTFILCDNGNVGIGITDTSGVVQVLVAYDATMKAYFQMGFFYGRTAMGPEILSIEDAQKFGFDVFRELVKRNLI